MKVNINKIRPWDKNPRVISEQDFNSLKKKVKRWGLFKPFIVWKGEGVILGGNQRYRACRDLGITELWVSYVEPKDEAEALEIAIADNESAGDWDKVKLTELIEIHQEAIKLEDYKITIKDQGLDDLLPIEIEEDVVPEVDEVESVCEEGDLWQLGEHRLLCGDSVNINDIDKLMDGKKPDMVLTDPPYGINYDSISTKGNRKYLGSIIGDDSYIKEWVELVEVNSGYVFCRYDSVAELYQHILNCDYNIFTILVWDKLSHTAGDLNSWASTYELVIYYGKSKTTTKRKQNVIRLRRLDNGIVGDQQGDNMVHPTQKPVKLIAEILEVEPAKAVLDLFGGSGTTLMACEQLDRKCYMMELDPHYCDVIIKRWETLTGEKAVKLNG